MCLGILILWASFESEIQAHLTWHSSRYKDDDVGIGSRTHARCEGGYWCCVGVPYCQYLLEIKVHLRVVSLRHAVRVSQADPSSLKSCFPSSCGKSFSVHTLEYCTMKNLSFFVLYFTACSFMYLIGIPARIVLSCYRLRLIWSKFNQFPPRHG